MIPCVASVVRRSLVAGVLLILVASGGPSSGKAQPATSPFPTYAALQDSLEELAALPDAAARTRAVSRLWTALTDAQQVPFAVGDSVAFLYRGAADAVAWNGDFNAWGNDGGTASTGRRVADTDLWILEHTFPVDARVDYKVVVDGTWILDPANPHQQWSGFGPNSELRMPEYVTPPETIRRPGVPHGTLGSRQVHTSTHLGYDVAYRVYTPVGYADLAALPTLYVTDGHEYADDRLGSMRIVLDNLIGEGVIEPILVVFVDPRDPQDPGMNRRQVQYVDDYAAFAAFLADELVPAVDGAYRTQADPAARGIMGTSFGGVFAAYLGVARSDVFRRVAIHSPAFWYDAQHNADAIYAQFAAQERLPLRLFMSTGTIHDTAPGARRMRDLLTQKDYPLTYVEVPEGHSWGNWRGLLDVPLMQFWGTDAGRAATGAATAPRAP
jgi:enterochelin esterase family protein